jgi:hypothetical protein
VGNTFSGSNSGLFARIIGPSHHMTSTEMGKTVFRSTSWLAILPAFCSIRGPLVLSNNPGNWLNSYRTNSGIQSPEPMYQWGNIIMVIISHMRGGQSFESAPYIVAGRTYDNTKAGYVTPRIRTADRWRYDHTALLVIDSTLTGNRLSYRDTCRHQWPSTNEGAR